MRILFLSTIMPWGRKNGGEIVTAHLVVALRRAGHIVKVLGYNRDECGSIPVALRPIETRLHPWHALMWGVRALFSGQAYSVQKYIGKKYREVVAKELQEQAWDRVFIDHAQMGWLLPVLKGHHIIHVSHNHESAIYGELACRKKSLVYTREAHLLRVMERRLARSAQLVMTLTRDDGYVFQRYGAKKTIHLPVPVPQISNASSLPMPSIDVALIGNWTWHPNRLGLDWFCDHIMPHMPKDIKIVVAGEGAQDLRGKFENMSIVGKVPVATDFLKQARVIAVPSIAGGGIQIKTLDAVSIGRPVVATSFALRGIDALPNRVLEADKPEDFVAKLTHLVRQPTCNYSDNWAERRYEVFASAVRNAI